LRPLPTELVRLQNLQQSYHAQQGLIAATAWQARDRKQREEIEKLEAEKIRLFGHASGDGGDEVLCLKMMEYFGGLDFIEG
jgi:hypothetical protein